MKITDKNNIVWDVYYPESSAMAMAPEDILSRLLTVDGPGSGLNADLLDGFDHLELSTANDGVVDVTHPAYGVVGDGSDESAKLQAAFDAAALRRNGAGRPTVRIPPGKVINIGAANLTLLHGIDFDMRGSQLVSSAASGSALTIGADGYFNGDLVAFGVSVFRDYGAAADPHLHSETIGVRFINTYRPTIKMGPVEGFRRCVQFRAAFGTAKQAGYCFEGHVFLSRVYGKYGLSLLNADKENDSYGSWVNAMRFHGGDFSQPYSSTVGRVAGVIYEIGLDPSVMPVDGQVLQNNVFDSPVFQLGGGGEPAFSASGTVPAGHVGACYVDGGYSYLCTQSGTFGSTPLSTLSKTPGATITSGSTTWTVEGKYVRSPFIFDKCGQSMICRDPYWETGVGPFLHFIGKTAGSGHRVTGVYLGGPVANMTRLVGDRDGDRGSWNWDVASYLDAWSKLNNVVEMGPQAGQSVQLTGTKQIIRSDNWHRRFIKGQTNWQAAGLAARNVDSLSAAIAADYKLGDGCIITGGGGNLQFGVLIPTDQYKRFRVTVNHKSGQDIFSGMVILGFDDKLVPVSLGPSMTVAPDIMADRGHIVTFGGTNIMYTSPNNWEFWVAVADNIKYIHISNSYGHAGDSMDGIEVEAFLDSYLERVKPLTFKEPFSSSVEARRSDGTPTQGWFMTGGEYIINSNASGTPDSVNGWVVSTAGILAPDRVASSAVHLHELRSNNGNVYAANSAFTTGSGGGPSGTGTAITDGTGSWRYVAPIAVLSQVLQYRPHDTRSDLDYAPYQTLTALLGTDSDSDGQCDGMVTHTHGDQTGISRSYSVSANRQDFSFTRGVGSDGNSFVRETFTAALVNGKEYFLLIKGHATNAAISLVGFIPEIFDTVHTSVFDISSTFYAPDGYVQSPIGQANGSGDIVIASRFLAPSTDANLYTVSLLPAQWEYPALPHTTNCYVTDMWVIDIAAAETALGISLAGLSSGELYAIFNSALAYVPPLGVRVRDTVTGLTKTITVASGVVTVV